MAAAAAAAAAALAAAGERQVMVVGMDDSEYSYYALQWTLRHFFSGPTPLFRLVIVHARRSAASVVGIAGPATIDVLPIVESDLRKMAARVIDKAKELCAAHQWQTFFDGETLSWLWDAG